MTRLRTENDLEEGIARLVLMHPELVPIAKASRPYILHTHEPGFPGLARIIIAQQVSLASAAAVYARFARTIRPVSPAGFLQAGQQAWIDIGLTRPKQRALNECSTALVNGSLDLAEISELPSEEAIRVLTKVKGIGPWTAEVYLAMCAGRTDIFPASDLALQEAVRLAFGLDQRPDEASTRKIASKWAPMRTFAANLFWSYYIAVKEGRVGNLSENAQASSEKKG